METAVKAETNAELIARVRTELSYLCTHCGWIGTESALISNAWSSAKCPRCPYTASMIPKSPVALELAARLEASEARLAELEAHRERLNAVLRTLEGDIAAGSCDWGNCNREAFGWRVNPHDGQCLPVCDIHTAHAEEQAATIARLRENNATFRSMLKAREWTLRYATDVHACFFCQNEMEQGHKATCAFSAALLAESAPEAKS